MKSTERDVKIVKVLNEDNENYSRVITKVNELQRSLDAIGRTLSTYFDAKRADFPRLFVVSDPSLLALLADVALETPPCTSVDSGCDAHSHPGENTFYLSISQRMPEVFPSLSGMRAMFDEDGVLDAMTQALSEWWKMSPSDLMFTKT